MTPSRSWVAPLATSGSTTCLQVGVPILSGFLSAVVIDRIGFGGQYLPLLASVAYEDASVRGVTTPVPSTAEGLQPILLPSPWSRCILVMVSRTLVVPSFMDSDAN